MERCHNLRPPRDGSGGLEGVGRPAELFTDLLPGAFFVPGGLYALPDGTVSTLLCLEEELYIHHEGELLDMGYAGGDATVAVVMTDGWIVMTTGGPVRLRLRDGVWGIATGEGELPRFMFERLDGTTFFADTAAMTATADYTSVTGTVHSKDAVGIGRALSDAYMSIAALARDERQFIQPVIARYRLVGEGEDVLYTSAPVMISPAAGLQLRSVEIPLSGSPARSLESTRISATGFTLGLRMTSSPDLIECCPVKRVEILLSPELHPLEPGQICHCELMGKSGGGMSVKALLPGLSRGKRPGEPGASMHSRIGRLLGCLESVMQVAASAPLPSAASAEIRLGPYADPCRSTAEAVARFRLLTCGDGKSVGTAGTAVGLIRPPHSFTASAGTRCGDVVMWGDITSRPFRGYPLDEMTVKATILTGGATPAAVAVTMEDGNVAVSSSVIVGVTPLKISPLLVYPSGLARSMTINTPASRSVFALSPAPGGTMSFRLDPDLAPVDLPEGNQGGFFVPVSTVVGEKCPDLVVISPAASPLAPEDAVATGIGAVTAIAPVSGGGSSLDMTRVKFHLFGSGGVALLNCRPWKISSLSVTDSCGVTSAGSVTVTPAGVVALVGGSPVLMSGSRSRSLGPLWLRGTAIGWNSPRSELWIFCRDSLEAYVMGIDGSGLHSRTVERTSSLLTTPEGLLMLTAAGHALDASRETDVNVRFSYRVRFPVSWRPGDICRLVVGLTGKVVGAEINLFSDDGCPDPEALPLLSLSPSGELTHPLTARFHAVHSHYLTLEAGAVTSVPSRLKLK